MTVVEWLQEEIKDLIPNDIGSQLKFKNKVKKAKEMEKENIKKGWLQDRDITFGDWQQEFEQWYNVTFKSE